MEQNKFTRFKRIILTIIFITIFVLSTSFCLGAYQSYCGINHNNIEQIDTLPQNIGNEQIIVDTIRTQEDVKVELVEEVTKYMKTKTNNHHQFIPKYLVYAGLKYNIDICFMMAQTQVETCYGTKGAGRETSRRSLFGVAIQKYSNYEEAVDKYCKLLHKYYIGKGKNEQHLLTKYVTFSGKRYAENQNYEQHLKTAYNHIKKNTHIYKLQQEYKNMSEIL